jgi:hypothetical protein
MESSSGTGYVFLTFKAQNPNSYNFDVSLDKQISHVDVVSYEEAQDFVDDDTQHG